MTTIRDVLLNQISKDALIELKTRFPGQTAPVYVRPISLAESDRIDARTARIARDDLDIKGEPSNILKAAVALEYRLRDGQGNKLFKAGEWQQIYQARGYGNAILALLAELTELETAPLQDPAGN